MTERPVQVFGGPGVHDGASTAATTDVVLQCPADGGRYTCEVTLPVPSEERLVSVEQVSGEKESEAVGISAYTKLEALSAGPAAVEAEFAAWVSESAAKAVDYVKTMGAAAAGLVPAYFAVLGYLGSNGIHGAWRAIAVVPPALFVVCVVASSLAQRPRLVSLTLSDFEEFRARRLVSLSRWISATAAALVAGLVLAVVVWGHLVG